MTCEAFLERLYDDDARAAARGQRPIPPDMAGHMLACEACRTAFESAGADELMLTRALLEAPPPAWRAQVLRQIARSPRAAWTQRIATVNEAVTWGILAVAASHVLVGESSTAAHVAAFWAGGAAVVLGPSLGKHWAVLRRPLRSSIA